MKAKTIANSKRGISGGVPECGEPMAEKRRDQTD